MGNITEEISFKSGDVEGVILIIDKNENRDEMIDFITDKGYHGASGVYYHIKNVNSETPSAYAGKAYHLGRRAFQKSRLIDVDKVILICLKTSPGEKEIVLMDENWRQQMEYLLIHDLRKRAFFGCIELGNTSVESQSLCKVDEKKRIREFFEEAKSRLEEKLPNVFLKFDTGKISKIDGVEEYIIPNRTESLWIKESVGAFVKKGTTAKGYSKDEEKNVFKGINLSHHREKTGLIDLGILVKRETETDFIFKEDHLFSTKTEAAAILIHKNQFRKNSWKLRTN